jgi:hypothetical protein
MDNASPHRSKQTTDCLISLHLVSAPHPPYSSDLTPSDFSLFGKVWNLLTGNKFASADEFIHEISQIGKDELNTIFTNWEVRLNKCITLDREYVDQMHSKNGIGSLISLLPDLMLIFDRTPDRTLAERIV